MFTPARSLRHRTNSITAFKDHSKSNINYQSQLNKMRLIAHSMGEPLRILGSIIIAIGALGGIGSSSDPYRRNLSLLIGTWGFMVAFEGSVLSELPLIDQMYKGKLMLKIITSMLYTSPILSTMGVLMWALFQYLTLSWGLTFLGALSIGLLYRYYQSQSHSRASV